MWSNKSNFKKEGTYSKKKGRSQISLHVKEVEKIWTNPKVKNERISQIRAEIDEQETRKFTTLSSIWWTIWGGYLIKWKDFLVYWSFLPPVRQSLLVRSLLIALLLLKFQAVPEGHTASDREQAPPASMWSFIKPLGSSGGVSTLKAKPNPINCP